MAVPTIQNAFTIGEVSPSLFGRTDLARFHIGASTFRNGFVSYRGGFYSRAGTKFVGFSKQTGRQYPPRLIDFQFSINQGLALEFGNFYMRVISNGAFVLETPISMTGATKANPCVITAAASGAATATAIDAGVTVSYVPGEQITLAGGTFAVPAVVNVTNTKLLSLLLNNPGAGVYAPGDTINLAGGTQSTPAVVTVNSTQVVSATVAVGGAGGAAGTQTVTGTTGTGTKFQAQVTVAAGAITAVLSISLAGAYTVNPAAPATEPVTGAGLVGAQLNVKLGVLTFTIFNAGIFTANAPSGNFTQASTSGTGTGATFQFGIFGPNAVTVLTPGVYTVFPANPVAQASSTGAGLGVTFNCTTTGVASFSNGDWVYVSGVAGMTQLNGQTYVIQGATTTTFQLFDVYGNPIDSTAFGTYTAGGTVSRVYTLETPYAEADLPYLKFTQSADVMSICCVNQETLTEYPPQDLSRLSDVDWVFTPVVAAPSVSPPGQGTGVASAGGSLDYQYVITAVDPDDGTESIASPVIKINAAVNIAATAGSLTLTWPTVPGVNEYNVYKATPGFGVEPPVGALFGYAGSAYGTQFVDSNITADMVQVPPQHKDPFAQGQVITGQPVVGGTGYTTVTLTINTLTGSGAQLQGVLVGGSLVAILVIDPGKNYAATDTITVTGDGVNATAILRVGPQTGTYPSVVSYFQERRGYASSLNNPDTYWFSQPGAFTNFDSRLPTIDSDAITGSPWSTQVNGIQFMVPMPGGLVVLTGLQAWQLTGTGGSSLNPQPISPSTQQAQPQAYNGCSATVPPLRIDYDIIYIQAKGSVYRDLSYQFYVNIYTGTDLTLNSSHLFTGYTIREHAWCEEPFKVLWSVRDDGVLLSLTYLKPEQVSGWGRHDTQGFFESVCSVTEKPVDAPYFAVQRFPGSHTCYTIERMDNRLWQSVEDCWCVDCALELAQPEPNATISASLPMGLGACTGVSALVGGTGYSAGTTATVVDDNGKGPGTGAVPTLTIVAGVITAVTFTLGNKGTNYVRPKLQIFDPAGSAGGTGASAVIVLDNTADFTTNAPAFLIGDVGKVIRMGGGAATITVYVSATHVQANITEPIVQTIPNSKMYSAPQGIARPQTSGNWTMTRPVTTVSGLNHLIGATVTGLADGAIITPQVVPANGTITLPKASTSVVVGLGFRVQLQSLYLDAGEPTLQGSRKKIAAVTARIEASRGLQAGANQPDGSVQSPPELAPTWSNLKPVEDKGVPAYNSTVVPLYTGDTRIPIPGGYDTRGQVCLQQDNPLPMNILALVSEFLPGDLPQANDPKSGGRDRKAAA